MKPPDSELQFVEAYSVTLGEAIFFVPDEDTKTKLIQAGVESGSIYTRDELGVLVAQHRLQPFTRDELLRIHSAKRTFNGTLIRS